ncbi:hypothetical protein [Escherichia coli]|uniref:defense against restriction DarA-related protein n=1 Tax=Escherichia coli TaxID=562 RepID=UPI003D9C25D4
MLPRPDEGDPYYEYARYGIATYDTPLSDQQMSEYDLKLCLARILSTSWRRHLLMVRLANMHKKLWIWPPAHQTSSA